MKTLSVAQAKNGLPAIIHEAEDGEDIGITRYGQPVAVLMSHERYRTLAARSHGFRQALRAFMTESVSREGACLDDGEVDTWRDRRPPRSESVFE